MLNVAGRGLGAYQQVTIQMDSSVTGWSYLAQTGYNAITTLGGIRGAAFGVGVEVNRWANTFPAYRAFTYKYTYSHLFTKKNECSLFPFVGILF